jgi:hypothetical protein
VIVNLDQLESQIERLARAKHVVVHRTAPLRPSNNRIEYFVCDYRNEVLFPTGPAAHDSGASAEETHEWLSRN